MRDFVTNNLNSDEYREYIKSSKPGAEMPKTLERKIVGLLQKGLIFNRYMDRDLGKAIKSENEIFVKCDSYYLVHSQYYFLLEERFL